MPKRNKINGMRRYGGVAQLGERHTGSVEVIGSIPTVSTNDKKDRELSVLCPFLCIKIQIIIS